jgi:hypothetical protein
MYILCTSAWLCIRYTDYFTLMISFVFSSKLLRYLKKKTKTDTEKNTDNQYFFTIVFCIILCKICLILCKSFCFQIMPNSHDITALTHRVRDNFNKVWGQWSVASEMFTLRIENACYLLALIIALDESCMISPDKQCPMRLVFAFLKHL